MPDQDKNQNEEKNPKESAGQISRRDFAIGSITTVAALGATTRAIKAEVQKAEEIFEKLSVKGTLPPVTISEEQVQRMFPVEKFPRIPTMDRPLIILCSCPGWQIGGKRYPAVPISIEDQAKELAASVKAGAIAIHVHPRNPNTGFAMISSALLKTVLDATFDKCGDCVTMSHTWYPKGNGVLDYITETKDLLEWGHGNKYCQGSVVLPFQAAGRAEVDKGMRWLDKNGVKPLIELYDTSAQVHFKELIDNGALSTKPWHFVVNLGKHDSTAIHQDPGSYLNAIANLDIVQKTFPDSIYGWRTGGRNWLPIAIMGMMMGVVSVQCGIEDAYWRWPHRDELIPKASESVKWIVEIANILGRRVVTDANEARQLCGMKLSGTI